VSEAAFSGAGGRDATWPPLPAAAVAVAGAAAVAAEALAAALAGAAAGGGFFLPGLRAGAVGGPRLGAAAGGRAGPGARARCRLLDRHGRRRGGGRQRRLRGSGRRKASLTDAATVALGEGNRRRAGHQQRC